MQMCNNGGYHETCKTFCFTKSCQSFASTQKHITKKETLSLDLCVQRDLVSLSFFQCKEICLQIDMISFHLHTFFV